MITVRIPKKQTEQLSGDDFITEASAIGLEPGCWPDVIELELPAGSITLLRRNWGNPDEFVRYFDVAPGSDLALTVFND